ncbi:MAG: Smr/MutS family protein [Desulfovibrio sp.]|jgi:DNA mismatch repair protein MutS2|nr:Smr/MutS family protein [Desulfovibrio sp.]
MAHQRTLDSLEFGKISERLASLCESAAGRERALALRPFLHCGEAVHAAEIYAESLVCFSSGGREDAFSVSPFPDIGPLLERASDPAKRALDIEALWAIRETLKLAQSANKAITAPQEAVSGWPNLFSMAVASSAPVQLTAALVRCISDDALVQDAASPELYRLRVELRKLHRTCSGKIREFAGQYNLSHYLQDEFITLSSDRYVLPLKSNFKGRMQGIIHDWSQTGETCYFEPMFLLALNNRLQELKREERVEEQKIIAYLQNMLSAELDEARAAFEFLAQLDVLQAKRRMARLIDGHCLSLGEPGEGINLMEARHPILALEHAENGLNARVRPLDIQLRPGEQALVITGGNAGGKTVCLKTLGLVAVMTYSGLPAPVTKGSHIPWFDHIDAFIGDEQSIENSVSTFSAQIRHLAEALKHLDCTCLVLLDEFGVGTDPAEGSALALAVCDALVERGAHIFVATHFPALKVYALTRERVRAASMLFDPKTRKPLFRLAYDQVGPSHALPVAREYGLPLAIIDRAEQYLLQHGQDASDMLERLNELAAQRDRELRDLARERERAGAAMLRTQERLERERTQLYKEIRSQAAELMRAWKDGRAGPKQALKEMSKLRAALALSDVPGRDSSDKAVSDAQSFLVGQNVRHRAFNKFGAITEVDARRGRVRLDLGGITVWAKNSDIAADCGAGAPAPESRFLRPSNKADEECRFSVDLRGMTVSEALSAADRFLDQSLLAGRQEVEIVHGRGTGALRRELHSFLRTLSSVEFFETASEERGGDGMTIVSLR